MEPPRGLGANELYHPCDPEQFEFATTAELEAFGDLVAQDRAIDAVEFGASADLHGYNLFILGREGTGRHTFVRQYLEEKASREEPAFDWCYVNNFEEPRKPTALRLPAGRGRQFAEDLEQLVDDAHTAIPSAFESEDYRTRREAIEQEAKETQEKALEEVNKEAEKRGVGIMQTPTGIAFGPLHRDEPISPREFELLPEDEQERFKRDIEELGQKFRLVIQAAPKRVRAARNKIRELDREVAMWAVGTLIRDLIDKYKDYEDVAAYLESVERDVIANIDIFRTRAEEQTPLQQLLGGGGAPRSGEDSPATRRYGVNVIVDNEATKGAPVVFEDQPNHGRLLGDIEHVSQMGTLVTDFHLIKAGALHRANGGYVVLDARKVLVQPLLWDGLKRALHSSELRIESLGQAYSLVSTVSLEPEPIPLSVKVVLIGDRLLYYLLQAFDPEFSNLFKVAADFEDEIERTSENTKLYAQLLGTIAQRESLKPLDRSAVARVIEESARLASDGEKLSARIDPVADVVREAHYLASKNGDQAISAAEIDLAIDQQARRSSRIRDRLQEQILRETILIDTEGEQIGQVNGLSVIQLGDFAFGRPNRITARVSLGSGKVIDIEREVELGGPIHSKGVLILASYLASQYVNDQPLSLSASLVFEQSYGGVEGDSASCAELCALLSALGRTPIKQSFAITGSVNQLGRVQAIGGVNQKIEGFFDICKARGLNGQQGVLIPASNVSHLMLRREVRTAVEEGRFHVYPVETVDQCMETLTGVQAGKRNEQGDFPEGSVNHRITARLIELAVQRRTFARGKESEESFEQR